MANDILLKIKNKIEIANEPVLIETEEDYVGYLRMYGHVRRLMGYRDWAAKDYLNETLCTKLTETFIQRDVEKYFLSLNKAKSSRFFRRDKYPLPYKWGLEKDRNRVDHIRTCSLNDAWRRGMLRGGWKIIQKYAPHLSVHGNKIKFCNSAEGAAKCKSNNGTILSRDYFVVNLKWLKEVGRWPEIIFEGGKAFMVKEPIRENDGVYSTILYRMKIKGGSEKVYGIIRLSGRSVMSVMGKSNEERERLLMRAKRKRVGWVHADPNFMEWVRRTGDENAKKKTSPTGCEQNQAGSRG